MLPSGATATGERCQYARHRPEKTLLYQRIQNTIQPLRRPWNRLLERCLLTYDPSLKVIFQLMPLHSHLRRNAKSYREGRLRHSPPQWEPGSRRSSQHFHLDAVEKHSKKHILYKKTVCNGVHDAIGKECRPAGAQVRTSPAGTHVALPDYRATLPPIERTPEYSRTALTWLCAKRI